MTDTHTLHQALIRPAIIHILRAAGFHSTKPSVLDTLTDLCSRHLLLLAQRTAQSTYDRTALPHARDGILPTVSNTTGTSLTPVPSSADILAAFSSLSVFTTALTPTEEAWRETLRRPLSTYAAGATREKERRRRDAEDVADVQDFIDWCTGHAAAEIRRIAGAEVRRVETSALGLGKDTVGAASVGGGLNIAGGVESAGAGAGAFTATVGEPVMEKVYPEDYLAQMKKKYSRTGDGARYAGTVLGSKHGREGGEDRGTVRIEGGPESLREWKEELIKRRKMEGHEVAGNGVERERDSVDAR